MSLEDRAEDSSDSITNMSHLMLQNVSPELLAKSQEKLVHKAKLGTQERSSMTRSSKQQSGFQEVFVHGNFSGITFGGK